MDSKLQSPIDLVISRLRRSGCDPEVTGPGQWEAHCPLHRGSKHNLGVKDCGDTLMINCLHVGDTGNKSCPPDEILKALDLTWRDLYVRRNEPSSSRRRSNEQKKVYASPDLAIAWAVRKHQCKPTCFWSYYESHQNQRFELMRIYRFDPPGTTKKCFPIHPTHEGWQVGDPTGKLPLYGLPEIASAETVVVTEGEKCADLVRSMGLVSTTSSHGAGSANRTDWQPLAGKSVIILPDNDEEGEGYALSVGRLLLDLDPAPAIRILRLPNLEKKWDIQQWIQEVVPDTWDLRDCRIEFERLCKDLPLWQPPPGCIPLAKPQPGDDAPPKLTELGNSKRLVKSFEGSLRYDCARNCWMLWNQIQWSVDQDREVWRRAKRISQMLYAEAGETFELDEREARVRWGLMSEKRNIIAASVELARSEKGVIVMPSQFDKDPSLLNAPNGVVDLLTGDVRQQSPDDMLSKVAGVKYDPDHPIPRWLDALGVLCDGDTDLVAYLKRVAGYSITGYTSEHAMFFLYGIGRNGKNFFADTLRMILGEYATVCDPRILLASGQNEHPAALADLAGRRLVITSEIDVQQRLAEAQVKRLTGDRTIKARFMNQNWFEFEMTAKLWMLANTRPEIQGRDEGIWSRLRVIPFDVVIPKGKRIRNLSEVLIAEEGPGILAWAVEGAREWHRDSLDDPERVSKAVDSYRKDQDVIGDFLQSCCVERNDADIRMNYRVEAKALYRSYVEWCAEMGERDPLTAKRFATEVTNRGFELRPSDGKHYRLGLAMKEPERPSESPGATRFSGPERTKSLPY